MHEQVFETKFEKKKVKTKFEVQELEKQKWNKKNVIFGRKYIGRAGVKGTGI